jgi:alkylhydroperoxidase/carboxymuconolactone decarboxylase family protein YurZ
MGFLRDVVAKGKEQARDDQLGKVSATVRRALAAGATEEQLLAAVRLGVQLHREQQGG